MAHLTKYSMGSVRAILEHDTRTANHSYKNPDIDRSKTHLNYSFVDSTLTAQERLEKRLSEVKVQKRKDVNVLASWIVTLPTNYKLEEERLFFKTVNDFLTEKYGKNNVISSDVHLDETTPHLHFTFVPVVKNIRKYNEDTEITLTEYANAILDKKQRDSFRFWIVLIISVLAIAIPSIISVLNQ